ncbi:MAG: signal peptidase I [Gammaproteobacteria bacterium]
MNVDFATILVALTAISGAITLGDSVFLSKRRKIKLAPLGPKSASEEIEQTQKTPIIIEYARSFFPIFLIVLLLRSFLVEPFRIPSASMMPTLLIGDFILVNKYTYGIRLPVLNAKIADIGSPKRGDVVVFRYPEDPTTPYIKRVVGLPGDHIAYNDKVLFINGQATLQDEIRTYAGVGAGIMMTGALMRGEQLDEVKHTILVMPEYPSLDVEVVVPENQYFVLGDNRDNSKDSRYWGMVPDKNLIGKAFLIWMNWDSKNGGIDWRRIGDRIY